MSASTLARFLLTLLVLALLGGPAAAWQGASNAPIIRDVRVGFPKGPEFDYFKPGCWTPILIEIGPQLHTGQTYAPLSADFTGRLTVSSIDGDGQNSTFVVEPVSLRRDEITPDRPTRTYLAYLRAGRSYTEISVTLFDDRRQRIHEFSYPGDRRAGSTASLTPRNRFTLQLGRAAGVEPPRQEAEANRGYDPNRTEVASQPRIEGLPQFWFGYESANTIVLPTGGTWAGSLAQAVANDPARREALEQWVAQGGHLVVAVAANAGPVSNRQSFPLEPLLPATIDPAQTAKVAALSGVSDFINREVPREARQSKEARPKVLTTELARLTPRGSARVLAMEPSQGSPAIVQGTHGLGRVTLLAFDVDFGPIAEWESRYDLWTAVMDYRPPPQGDRAAARAWGGGITEVGEALATGLESFGDVTVVPFFWVAIFILIYIILIGPVDYLFLKKVVKRLELTWITFPTLVLAISVAAYFAAVWLKGDEMRINKVDVVDVDVTRQRCVGTTWFSIFSPKLQTYDLTLRPVGLGELSKDSLVLSWLPRAGWGARGMDRMQSPDLFRRSYTYADNASRLVDVPIQVWAMKSLQGRWQSELDPDQPLVRHTLRESRLLVAGTVTSYLPGPLRGARLVYRDAIWDLGTLEPGKPTALPTAFQELRANSIFVSSEPPRTPSGQLLFNFVSQLNPILFNRVTSRQQAEMTDNTYVDHLDQTGRLAFRQAMLVGVLEDVYGSAAEINAGIKLGTQLDFSRPPLQGVMRQVTVVRLHLELAASEEK